MDFLGATNYIRELFLDFFYALRYCIQVWLTELIHALQFGNVDGYLIVVFLSSDTLIFYVIDKTDATFASKSLVI